MNAMTDRLSTVEDTPAVRRAARIQERMDRLGLKPEGLIAETGRARQTIFNALKGKASVREPTWRDIEQTLGRLEARDAGNEPEAVMPTESGLIEFEIVGVFGVDRVIVRGPVGDAAELEQAAANIIRDLRERRGDTKPIE